MKYPCYHEASLNDTSLLDHPRPRQKVDRLIPKIGYQGWSLLGQFTEPRGVLLHNHTSLSKVDKSLLLNLLFSPFERTYQGNSFYTST